MIVPLTPLWPERFRSAFVELGHTNDRVYHAEAAEWTAAIRRGDRSPPEPFTIAYQTPGWFGHTPLPLDPTQFHVYAQLPTIARTMAALHDHFEAEGLDGTQPINVALHAAYHQFCWRTAGRRTYVLDRTLVEDLLASDVPAWPLHQLALPVRSAYVVLPEAFAYVTAGHDPVPQPLEGVFYNIPDTTPDTPREIHLFCTGKSPHGVADDNVLFLSLGLGPDTLLSDVRGPDGGSITGALSLATLPALLLGLMLYLTAEHPDVHLVKPEPLEPLDGVRNLAKRRKIEQRNARRSQLPRHYVGSQHRLAALGTRGAGRRLTNRTLVRGHWREQAYGTAWTLRRTVWIHPHFRAADAEQTSESLHLVR